MPNNGLISSASVSVFVNNKIFNIAKYKNPNNKTIVKHIKKKKLYIN